MKTIRVIAICLATSLFLAGVAQAQLTSYVRGDGSGSDANNGQSWATAYATIQQALNQINGTWPSNNVTINVQASTGGQAYEAAGQMNLTAASTNYFITVSGGWTDVDGTPAQTGVSRVSDSIGPVDQAGLSFGGGGGSGGKASQRTMTVSRMAFERVWNGVYVTGYNYPCNPYLILDSCTVTSQNHGVYINYPGIPGGGLNQQAFLAITNSTITGGLGGSGDGIRVVSAYSLVDIAPNTTVTGLGGQNVYLMDGYVDSSNGGRPSFYCNFLGTFGLPGLGYDAVKYGGENMILTNSSTFTRKVALNGGLVRARAQNVGACLTTGTVELNTSVALQLNADATVANTAMGPLLARNGLPILHVNGVSGGTVWTTAALNRENRAVMMVRGNGATTYALTTNDQFKITAAPTVENGMVAPWLMGTDAGFLNYDGSGPGLKPAVYSRTNTINSAGDTDLLLVSALQTQSVDRTVYALRCTNTGSITNLPPGTTTNTLTIASGGISASFLSSSSAKDATILSNLRFGTDGEKEALIFVGQTGDQPKYLALAGSLTTTNGLTKTGYTVLRLSGDNTATLSGPITINSGTLQVNNPNALPPNASVAVFSSLNPSLSDSAYRTYSAYLDLFGNNLTLGRLTLGDAGAVKNSAATPATLTLNGDLSFIGTLSPANTSAGTAISSTPANPLKLDLGSTRRTFDVARGSPSGTIDLPITAPIAGTGGITKTGDGILYLNCTSNTFSGGLTLQGGLVIGVTTNFGSSTPFGDPSQTIQLQRKASMAFAPPNSSGCTSTVGAVTFSGANSMSIYHLGYNYNWTNVCASLNRAAGTRGTLYFMGPNQNNYPGLNANFKILFAAPPTVANGMLAPYIVHAMYPGLAPTYAYYDSVLGIKACTYNKTGNFTATSLLATDLADMTTSTLAAGTNFTANIECWALRTVRGISMSGGSWTLTLGSGGLMVNSTVPIAPAVKFGSSGTAEGVVYVNAGAIATLTNAIITTGGLTKFGDGTLILGAASPDFSGDVYVQAGTLALTAPNALGTGAATVYLESGTMLDIFTNALPNKTIKGTGQVTTYNAAPLTATLSPAGESALGTLSIGSLDFRGTYTWEYGATGADLVQASGLAFGGSVTLNVTWLGEGSAPAGSYTLFNYSGADPAPGTWTVNAPSGLAGAVTVDAANKRVLLTLSKSTFGTLIMFR